MSIKTITKYATTCLVDPGNNKFLGSETDVHVTAGKIDDGSIALNITFCEDKVFQVVLNSQGIEALIQVLVELSTEGEVLQ